jgi:hypothetical protein
MTTRLQTIANRRIRISSKNTARSRDAGTQSVLRALSRISAGFVDQPPWAQRCPNRRSRPPRSNFPGANLPRSSPAGLERVESGRPPADLVGEKLIVASIDAKLGTSFDRNMGAPHRQLVRLGRAGAPPSRGRSGRRNPPPPSFALQCQIANVVGNDFPHEGSSRLNSHLECHLYPNSC